VGRSIGKSKFQGPFQRPGKGWSAATSAAWHWRRVYELSKEEAVRRIRLIDAEREAFFRRYLNEDVSNPDLYDLVLNQARLSMDSIVDIVVLGMESRGLVKIDAEPELSRAHA